MADHRLDAGDLAVEVIRLNLYLVVILIQAVNGEQTGEELLADVVLVDPYLRGHAGEVNIAANAATIQPDMEQIREALAPEPAPEPEPMPEIPEAPEPEETPAPDPALQDLANNPDFSIETIAQQAKRIEKQKNDNEVYISLH